MRSDGWAAGLQLSALAARSSFAQAGACPPLVESHVLIEDYVRHEVLKAAEPDVVDVLLRICGRRSSERQPGHRADRSSGRRRPAVSCRGSRSVRRAARDRRWVVPDPSARADDPARRAHSSVVARGATPACRAMARRGGRDVGRARSMVAGGRAPRGAAAPGDEHRTVVRPGSRVGHPTHHRGDSARGDVRRGPGTALLRLQPRPRRPSRHGAGGRGGGVVGRALDDR